MEVIVANNENIKKVANLAQKMWSNYSINDLELEFKEFIKDDKGIIFALVNKDEFIGFSQCSLRYEYVEGTNSSPVGYLEGIFIKEEYRKKGYAKELLKYCENWAKEKGCKEFASDCEIDNEISYKFHKKMGFIEANRIICFKKEM